MLGVVVRNPRFRTLWSAQVVSSAGDWLNRVAVLTLIGELSGPRAAAGVGMLFGAELALRLTPTAVMGPLAGPLADRLPRRALMVAADVLRTAIVLCFLFVDRPDELWMLYALLVAQMSVGIVFESAKSAALPDTVGEHDLHEALTLSAATWSAMLTIGAFAGGLLVVPLGVDGVFLVDAGTYVVSALLLARLPLPPVPAHPERFRWRDVLTAKDLRRGLAHVRELRLVPVLFTKGFWWPAGGFLVMLSVVGRERFGAVEAGGALAASGSAATGFATGMLFAARGLGTGLGPIVARAAMGSRDEDLRRQIVLGFLVAAGGYALFATAGELWSACAWVAVAHMGGSTIWVASTAWWQRHVGGAYRGRVYALEFLAMTLTFSAGGLLAGGLFDGTSSIATTVWAFCAVLLVMAGAWAWCTRDVVTREEAGTPGVP